MNNQNSMPKAIFAIALCMCYRYRYR